MRRNIARETGVCKPPLHSQWVLAGWHICIDVLDRLLDGTPFGRIVGADAMKVQRLAANQRDSCEAIRH